MIPTGSCVWLSHPQIVMLMLFVKMVKPLRYGGCFTGESCSLGAGSWDFIAKSPSPSNSCFLSMDAIDQLPHSPECACLPMHTGVTPRRLSVKISPPSHVASFQLFGHSIRKRRTKQRWKVYFLVPALFFRTKEGSRLGRRLLITVGRAWELGSERGKGSGKNYSLGAVCSSPGIWHIWNTVNNCDRIFPL